MFTRKTSDGGSISRKLRDVFIVTSAKWLQRRLGMVGSSIKYAGDAISFTK